MNFISPDGLRAGLGLSIGDSCLDLTSARTAGTVGFEIPESVEAALTGSHGIERLEKDVADLDMDSLARFMIPKGQFRPLAPVRSPQKLIGIGLNYHDHAKEVRKALPEQPLLFAMYPNAIVGYDDVIVIPEMSDQIDYEAELGVIIGRRGRYIGIDQAIDYIGGYTIVNDVSARDLQSSDSQWIRGKSFDTFAPMGPCLASTRALGDGNNLDIRLRLNGETMQDSNTRNMIFKVPELVSYISRVMTLEPGDIISTGTPSGVGVGRNPKVFLKAGDSVEIEVEGIGVLRNTVVKE